MDDAVLVRRIHCVVVAFLGGGGGGGRVWGAGDKIQSWLKCGVLLIDG